MNVSHRNCGSPQHGFSYHCYADDTRLFLSFPSSYKALIATCISECMADVSTWTTAHHLRFNLNKTELLMPGKDCPHIKLLVTVENITVSPSPTARNLGVVLENQLCCTVNIPAVARSCRIALYNILRITFSSAGHLTQTRNPSSIPPLNYLSWTSGTAIARSKQKLISKITTLLCFGTTVVEHRVTSAGSLSVPTPTIVGCTSWHLINTLNERT